MKKTKKNKNWIVSKKRDLFYRKSKEQGYRSRSAFKLIEMNKKFKFLRENSSLLDLGSSPGGWSQVVKREIKRGRILAIDTKKMNQIDNVNFIQGDFRENEVIEKIKLYFKGKVDVILSDMAADTTGNKSLDSYRTGELCLNAMDLAEKVLSPRGVFLSKIFMGSIYAEINVKSKKIFKKVINYKPISSKKESKEIYIFCKGILKI